jgi:hypothetical protein
VALHRGISLAGALTFARAAVAIQLAYHAFNRPDENWTGTPVALAMQTQAGPPVMTAAGRVIQHCECNRCDAGAVPGGTSIPSFAPSPVAVGLFC